MLLSINRFLNLDVSKPHKLFDWESLWFTKDNIELLDWIFEFQTGKADKDHYTKITESIIVSKNLYTVKFFILLISKFQLIILGFYGSI